jgi:hypothetical protein
MTRAFRCDKCHRFSVGSPVLNVTTKNTEPPVKERAYELCVPCTDKLVHDFLKPPTHDAPMDSYTEKGV